MTDRPDIMWQGRFIRAVRDGRWEYVQRIGTSGAVAIITVTDAQELVLVEQYRPPVQAPVIEIPAGLAGDFAGAEDEAMLTAAQRELLEETGYEASSWKHLFEGVTTAGLADESVCMFLATGLKQVHHGGGDDHEHIIVHHIALEEAEAWLAKRQEQGAKVDIKVYYALLLAKTQCGSDA